MALSARQGDGVTTGHPCDGSTTLAAPGQSTVRIEGQLACRITDLTVTHDILSGSVCVPHTAPITGSSGTVRIEGKLAARVGDGCDAGSISSSTQSRVRIGD